MIIYVIFKFKEEFNIKVEKPLIYISTLAALLIAGGFTNVNADFKQDNSINNSQDTVITENNSSDIINFPDASKNIEQVGDYVRLFSTKVSNTKSDLKNTKKQLSDAKTDKVKKNATKRINMANSNLAKLNDNKSSILNNAKQDVNSAEKKAKEAKTDVEHINANVSLNRAEISYSQLNRDLK